MESLSSRSPDLFGSASALFAGALASARNRLQLFSVELQEEKLRLVQLFVLVAATVFAGAMAIVFASATLVYLLWDVAPLATLLGATVFFSIGVATLIWQTRRFIGHQEKPFSGTLGELEKDRSCFRPAN